MNELVLRVDGRNYIGFKDVVLLRSIEQGPHQFELKIAPDLNTNAGVFEVEDGMSCQAYIDDDLLLTGAVDDINVDYDSQTHEITVIGRSKCGDLADCSTTGQQIKAGQTLLSVARQLCKPFGISVIVDSSATAAANQSFTATDLTLDAGQLIWEALEELARIRAVLLISDAAGNLVITRSGTGTADVPLVLGANIKAASAQRSHRSLFSEYTVAGQAANWATLSAEANSQSKSTITGDARRYRPSVIVTDQSVDNAACKARAEWQRRVSYGRSRSINYTMRGWRQAGDEGRIWMPNELVRVTDKFSGLDNTQRLITAVATNLTARSGRTSTLTVMPKAAFDLITQPESTSGATL
jgi:prophage tail gpP-like protein